MLLILRTLLTFLMVVCTTIAAEPEQGSEQHLQVLAASCAACHGHDGNSAGVTPVIAGLSSDYFVSQMLAFRTGQTTSTIMHHHAKGLTEDEIKQLAEYFSRQPRLPAKPAPHD